MARLRTDMASMRRSRPWLLTLALFASVSLSLLPTLGRLYRGAQPQSAAIEAFCTSRGLAWRGVDSASAGLSFANAIRANDTLADLSADARDDESDRTPLGGDASGDDCVYCALTATTALPAFAASLRIFEIPPQRANAHFAATAPPRPGVYDRSPRGPPVRIAA
jgi:hypothetical protein